MRKSILAAAISACAFVLLLSTAQAGTLIPVPQVPGSTYTAAVGINDSNIIAGTYGIGDSQVYGFVGTLDGQYTTIDYGYGYNFIYGISSDGYITGSALIDVNPWTIQAFVRSPDGSIAIVKFKNVALVGSEAKGITNRVKFVGNYYTDNQTWVGFLGKGARYLADLDLPFNGYNTRPHGYNKHGDIVGYYFDFDAHDDLGFLLHDGTATAVQYPDPDAYYTMLWGISDKGKIVGTWSNYDGDAGEAFFFDPATNSFKTIRVPGSSWSSAGGVNNAGLVTISSDVGEYVYCSRKKTCPQSPNAIEIPDKWIKAPPGSVHSVVCRNGCIGPWHGGNGAASKVDAATIRDAMKNDPALRMEMGLRVRR